MLWLYVKRSLLPSIDVVMLFQSIEKKRIEFLKPPPPIVSLIDTDVEKPDLLASDVTDLGDREFYANRNVTGRAFTDFSALDDNRQYLTLQDPLFEALVRVKEEKKGVFPRALLATLVSEERVLNKLAQCLSGTHSPT